MHSLLKRQLERHLEEPPCSEEWDAFIEAVDAAYHQADEDRRLLERSLEITSEELFERNERLRAELARREEAETQLQQYARRQTAIAQLGQLALEGIDIQALMEAATERVRDILDVSHCEILKYCSERDQLRMQAGLGKEGAEDHSVEVNSNSPAGLALCAQEPIVVDDLQTDPRFNGMGRLRKEGAVSGMEVVIEGGKGPWGVLRAYAVQQRDFSSDDIDFLQAVANVLAQSVEHRRAKTLLQNSEARFRAVTENATDLIAILDEEAQIRYAYGAISEVTGYEPDEWQRTSYIDCVHTEDREKLFAAISESVRRPGRIFEVELRFRHKDQSWHYLSLKGRNLIDQPGVGGILINVRDVTRGKRFEQELIEAKERAEEMVRLKSAFLANMSHEIRTPLTAILGFADALVDMTSGEKQKFARLIRNGGQRLSETLNSVLDLARLEAQNFEMQREPISIEDPVCETVKLFRSLAQRKDLSLKLDAPEQNVCVRTDRNALTRVLTNLLSNAVKFTEEGQIIVRIRPTSEWVYLEVEDTGVGIGDEFQQHLFSEFRQESTGFARSHEGTGLGLAITKRLVELMGGQIEVESTKGEGSRFTVTLEKYNDES